MSQKGDEMNQEEILKHIQGLQGNFGQKQEKPEPIPVEKIDEFINRVIEEKNESLFTLLQALSYKLTPPQGHNTIISIAEANILPSVVERIKFRLESGET